MFKFNGGRGARLCEHCDRLLTDGRHTIVPYVTVRLEGERSTGAGPAPNEAHFCRLACLHSEVLRMVESIDSGKETDDTAANLRRLAIAGARWEVDERKTLLPYDDAANGGAPVTMRIEIVGPAHPGGKVWL